MADHAGLIGSCPHHAASVPVQMIRMKVGGPHSHPAAAPVKIRVVVVAIERVPVMAVEAELEPVLELRCARRRVKRPARGRQRAGEIVVPQYTPVAVIRDSGIEVQRRGRYLRAVRTNRVCPCIIRRHVRCPQVRLCDGPAHSARGVRVVAVSAVDGKVLQRSLGRCRARTVETEGRLQLHAERKRGVFSRRRHRVVGAVKRLRRTVSGVSGVRVEFQPLVAPAIRPTCGLRRIDIAVEYLVPRISMAPEADLVNIGLSVARGRGPGQSRLCQQTSCPLPCRRPHPP